MAESDKVIYNTTEINIDYHLHFLTKLLLVSWKEHNTFIYLGYKRTFQKMRYITIWRYTEYDKHLYIILIFNQTDFYNLFHPPVIQSKNISIQLSSILSEYFFYSNIFIPLWSCWSQQKKLSPYLSSLTKTNKFLVTSRVGLVLRDKVPKLLKNSQSTLFSFDYKYLKVNTLSLSPVCIVV